MIDGLHNHPCIISLGRLQRGLGAVRHGPDRRVDQEARPDAAGQLGERLERPQGGRRPRRPRLPRPRRAAGRGEAGRRARRVRRPGAGRPGHTWSKETWGYEGVRDKADLTRKYERLLGGVWDLHRDRGLNAAVYTQLTDVETEANGLLTYDRAVIKVDLPPRRRRQPRRPLAASRSSRRCVPTLPGEGPAPGVDHSTSPPTAGSKPTSRRPTGSPARRASAPRARPARWCGPSGRRTTSGSAASSTCPKGDSGELFLLMHHDDDAEVYLNGVLAVEGGRATPAITRSSPSRRPPARRSSRART